MKENYRTVSFKNTCSKTPEQTLANRIQESEKHRNTRTHSSWICLKKYQVLKIGLL